MTFTHCYRQRPNVVPAGSDHARRDIGSTARATRVVAQEEET
jgi:hypothetical protein